MFLFILILFWQLAKRIDLICNTNGCFRGDGFRPYSLARGQMAFWFLVVIGASIFLWIAAGQLHVLNETCLWLIGIGSGTALGSAVIAGSDPSADSHTKYRLARKKGESIDAFEKRLAQEISDCAAATAAAPAGPEQDELAEKLAKLREQQEDPMLRCSPQQRNCNCAS